MAVAEKNCHHGIVSMAWYALNDDQNRRPERSTLKLPSRFKRRCWLSRDTTAPNPRSLRSWSLSAFVVASVAITNSSPCFATADTSTYGLRSTSSDTNGCLDVVAHRMGAAQSVEQLKYSVICRL